VYIDDSTVFEDRIEAGCFSVITVTALGNAE